MAVMFREVTCDDLNRFAWFKERSSSFSACAKCNFERSNKLDNAKKKRVQRKKLLYHSLQKLMKHANAPVCYGLPISIERFVVSIKALMVSFFGL